MMSEIELQNVPSSEQQTEEDQQPIADQDTNETQAKSSHLEVLPPKMETSDEENTQKREGYGSIEEARKFTINLPEPDEEGRKRRIDYVLVYQVNETEEQEVIERKEKFREFYFQNLTKRGLYLETQEEGDQRYVLVHVPYDVMFEQAEKMKMRVPLQRNDSEEPPKSWFAKATGAFSKLMSPPLFDEDDDDNEELAKKNPYNYYTAEFENTYKEKFAVEELGVENFFTVGDRIRVARYLLENAKFKPHIPQETDPETGEVTRKKEEGLAGCDRMIANGSLIGAFPLHDGSHKLETKSTDRHWINFLGEMNPRQKLYYTWSSPKMWYKAQPMDPIRRYFGEKIAIYFRWLGYYTIMLALASVVGIVAFIYGLISMGFSDIAEDACPDGKSGNFIMCPNCDKPCQFWLLSSQCQNIRLIQVVDNEATVIYAIFMAFWATMFLEFWKRKQNQLQFEWDLFDFEETQDTLRPEYEEKAQKNESSWMKTNPITKDLEPLMPSSYKITRIAMSISTVLFMIFVVIAAIVGVIIYRVIISGILNKNSVSGASTVTSMTAACLNLVFIMFFSYIYQTLATKLTDIECPRTETEYEDSYTVKMFVFQFVNFYSSIVYIAFFKGKTAGYPGNFKEIMGNRQEQCQPGGCLLELTMQLLIIMVGKQFINNVQEIGVPLIKEFVKKKKLEKAEKERVRRETEKRAASGAEGGSVLPLVEENTIDTFWEMDYHLEPQPKMNLFGEYLEMVIQYGFTTLFATAFPLAPFFAFINNVIEIRLDAYKFVVQSQRPWAQKAQDIGSWYDILYTVGVAAVLFNAFSLVFTSSFMDKQVYKSSDHVNQTYWDFVYTTANATMYFPNFECDPDVMASRNWTTQDECLPEFCYYRDYRFPDDSPKAGERTREFWNVMAAKLIFVIAFEHLVFITKFLVAFIIPDMPSEVKVEQLREQHLIRTILYEKND